MKKKIFLTSAIAMGFVAPAFAAPTYTSDTFPSTGLMQEDYTYTNAATADNMDTVYEGTVNATAEYEDIFYDIVAGNYLAAGSDDEDGTICPAGSYCSGLTHAPYNATSDQGKTSCPATYSLSAEGAKTEAECYRTCTSADVAHSKSTGTFTGMFYSNNTNACEPVNNESCANGYHYKAGTTGPNLTSLIGVTEAGEDYGYISKSGNNTNNEDKYGITQNGEFVVDYGSKGKIHGHAQCSTRAGTNPWVGGTYVLQSDGTTVTLPDSSGQYCYCQLDSYTPVSGTATALSAPWVFNDDYGGASNCAFDCAYDCAYNLVTDDPDGLAFRAALFGTLGSASEPASCEANTITINWSNASDTDVATNNAGTATYGSDVRTPVKAETIKGKTFKGWKFSKPTTTQLP